MPENDGKRFVVDGVLEIIGGVATDEGSMAEFWLSAPPASAQLPVVIEKGRLLTVNTGSSRLSRDKDSVVLHTNSGDAAMGERLKVTVRLRFVSQAACLFMVVALERPGS